MFSQFRQAVESLAPQPRRSIDAAADDQRDVPHLRSRSTDSSLPLSSGQLAESALSNLRKSLATQRAGVAMNKSASAPPAVPPDKPRLKMNLEERLRASLSTTDVVSTPTKSLPAVITTPQPDPLSPTSIPLPGSPISPLSSVQDLPQCLTKATDDAESLTGQSLRDGFGAAGADDSRDAQGITGTQDAGLAIGASKESDHPGDEEQATPFDDRNESSLVASPTDNASSSETKRDSVFTSNESFKELPVGSNSENKGKVSQEADLEGLRMRLKEIEEQFADVSTSFEHLQAEKLGADSVLHELTPLTGIQDATALKEYLKSLDSKADVFQEEIKRLNAKLEVQEDRVEELRETHKLSSASQLDQINRLQNQLRETEALFKESQKAVTVSEGALSKRSKEIDDLKSEAERLNTLIREEEEKRTKAISLLKTVRQKLVKAEKEKEDTLKELNAAREKEKTEADREQAEKRRLEREVEAANAEKETSIVNLRAQFEKDMTVLKERHEREMSAMRGQFELDAITTKSAHNKEITAKNSHITTLETSLNNVTRDKNTFFEQLQLRQAETESAQSHLESIQHQNTELQYQLRETNDRVALLKEDLNDLQREQELRTRESTTSAEGVGHLLAATESKYQAKVIELKKINATLEKERNDSEAEWSRKLKERSAEAEELKRLLGNSAKSREEEEEFISKLKKELGRKNERITDLENKIAELSKTCSRFENAEASAKSLNSELYVRIDALEKQIEEAKAKDTQVRQTNKALREELRKVQSSAALLEKQRNPGVGYWTTRANDSSNLAETRSSTPATSSRVNSPTPQSSDKNEEEVNLEYLRNVILQFLEHKEMRPNLIRVLSTILHFTPQETRRLMSKVG